MFENDEEIEWIVEGKSFYVGLVLAVIHGMFAFHTYLSSKDHLTAFVTLAGYFATIVGFLIEVKTSKYEQQECDLHSG